MGINSILRALLPALLVLALNANAFGAEKVPFGTWLTNAAQYPPYRAGPAPKTNLFSRLHSDVIGDQLKILWPAPSNQSVVVTLHASAASPGHWPVRDWRTYDMTWRNGEYEVNLPVEEISVPIVYYARAIGSGATNLSPNRLVHPARSGLERATKLFWPFIEGFEECMESWRTLANTAAAASVTPQPHDGKGSLLVTMPAGKTPVVIATTRVRGWQIILEGATGLRLWLRTRTGEGRVKFGLYSAAHSPDHEAREWPQEKRIGPAWQRIDLFFRELREGFARGETDLFSIEFAPGEAREFLVDDLQFLGPWRLDGGGGRP